MIENDCTSKGHHRNLAGFEIKSWTLTAAHHYATVRNGLERQSQPIGNMDLMFAAHALVEDNMVNTHDAREFHRVPGPTVEEWTL